MHDELALCRAGQLYVQGGATSATVSASGAGTTYLGGGNIGQVTVNVGGVGQVVIDPKNGALCESLSYKACTLACLSC